MADVVLSMGRKERRQHAEEYIRGLLMDGERKSIEPMADRLPDGDVQALQQFVNQSPWSTKEVQASLARKVEREFVPEAYWLVDEVSFPKQGKHSVGVARQYCGALGKTANCQVAVTLDLGTEESSTPLDWALYLPEPWIKDTVRRNEAGIPKGGLCETYESFPFIKDVSGQIGQSALLGPDGGRSGLGPSPDRGRAGLPGDRDRGGPTGYVVL